MKVVITGGPCTGKTTIINELAALGYAIVPEAARSVFTEELEKHGKLLDEPNTKEFQLKYLKRQRELEEKHLKGLREEEIAFLDHSIPQSLAYCEAFGIEPPKEIVEACKEEDYLEVFVLEQLGFYEKEGRIDKPGTAEKLQQDVHRALVRVYSSLGFEVVLVPKLPVKERVEFILNRIKKKRRKARTAYFFASITSSSPFQPSTTSPCSRTCSGV